MPRKTKPAGVEILVDELGALERELAPFAMKILRIEALRKHIREHYALQPPEKRFTITARKFVAELGTLAGGGTTVTYVTKASRSLKVMERPNVAMSSSGLNPT